MKENNVLFESYNYNVRAFQKVVLYDEFHLKKFNELLEFFDNNFYLIEISL